MDIETKKELRAAVLTGDIHRVRSLIGDSKERLQQNTAFGTWLHVAADAGHLEVVKCLISLGADINAKGGTFGAAAIGHAASAGHTNVVVALIDAGANFDLDEPERNPLFGAIYGGHLDIVKLLVERGIDFRKSYTGESMKDMDALAFARERGQKEIANYLAQLAS
jgi:ankyrin repeat protein